MTFHYIDDFGDLDGDNFSFSARLRNTFRRGDGACREAQLVIQCTDGAFVIPLSAPGCVGDLGLYIGGRLIDGRRHNLSAFGCDADQWQELRGEVRHRRLRLLRNGRLIWEGDYPHSIGRVAGVRLRFWGAGEVASVRLEDERGRAKWEASLR